MKRVLAIFGFLLLPLTAAGQTSTSSAEKPSGSQVPEAKEKKAPVGQPVDSPLVRAAKANRANAAKNKPRVILDDKDVKNSKGKLIYIKETPVVKTDALAPKPAPARPEQNPAVLAAKAAAKVEAARKEVAALERDMAGLEEAYYDEDDASYRGAVIRPRFEQVRRQLDSARQKLSDAREEQQRFEAQAATRNPNPQP